MLFLKELCVIIGLYILIDHDYGYCPAHIKATKVCGQNNNNNNKYIRNKKKSVRKNSFDLTRKYTVTNPVIMNLLL